MNTKILIIAIIILVLIIKNKNWLSTYFFCNYDIVNISKNNKKINHSLKDFEKRLTHWYPLGEDYFKINHGKNYFSFFKRLGEVHFAAAMKKDKIIGLISGVLRDVPLKLAHKDRQKVWYICDLKVDKKHRGKGLTIKMALNNLDKLKKTRKIYAVSMNSDKEENKILKLVKQVPFVKMEKADNLLIYSLNFNDMIKAQLTVMKHRGPISYASLYSIKDLKLKSTKEPMKLLHVQWGDAYINEPNHHKINYPIEDFTHMFCCPENDILADELEKIGITTNITATVLHYNMENCDWKFILTSDI